MIKQPYSPLFERFWQSIPRRGDKRAAETAFLNLRRRAFDDDEKDTDMLIEAVKWQVEEYLEDRPEDPKLAYFKHISTWLNGDCYERERPAKFDDCPCGKPNDGTHKYSMVSGRKVYKCTSCRGANLRIAK